MASEASDRKNVFGFNFESDMKQHAYGSRGRGQTVKQPKHKELINHNTSEATEAEDLDKDAGIEVNEIEFNNRN